MASTNSSSSTDTEYPPVCPPSPGKVARALTKLEVIRREISMETGKECKPLMHMFNLQKVEQMIRANELAKELEESKESESSE